jgi:hypothetical protein
VTTPGTSRRGARLRDADGYPVTAAGPATVARFDAAVDALVRFSDDVAKAWDATVADEPGFVMGHVGRAYLRCLSSEAGDARRARAVLDALGDPPALTDRERRHVDAARAYAAGDLHGAAERLARLSVDHPRDVLALAVGHQLDFFRGDALGLRDRVAGALHAFGRADPRYGFVVGMLAFGLEECGLYPQAEAAGRAALELDRRDVWALHAVVHVHEMQGRVHDGLAFMDARRRDWTDGNFFVVHNSWHEALFRLELGDVAGALDIYDTVLHHDGSEPVALEMLDAAALLWRLHLDGVDTGDRFDALAQAWADAADEPWYVFNDVHAVMAYVGASRLDWARAARDALRTSVAGGARPDVANDAMAAEVGLPVCEALVAFGEGRYADAVAWLYPIRRIVHRFGGSNAQRDAIARTLLEAAVRAGETALAEALVSERLAVKERSSYAWRQRARLARARGDRAIADAAEAEVAALRGVG